MEQHPWWHQTILYQVYPMSFQDTDGDGVGDIQGIIQRLDYIQSLGVNMLWLNPIFVSPKVDNGYDVADYLAIDPQFGTMEDVEELIRKVHQRNMKIVFDLVLNHTSDQHPWFQEALKGKDNPYRDYYIWKDGKNGGEMPPNNWEGFFRGSVWEKESAGDQYYFHLFSKEMPDLNWENPEVHRSLIEVADFWLQKGIDGFRLDAFIHIVKEPGYPDLDLPAGEIALAEQYYSNLPKVNQYMKLFTQKLREHYPDVFILGEAASANVELARSYCDPDEGGCNSVITFTYFTVDHGIKDHRLNGTMQKAPLLYGAFKENMQKWQAEMADVGGPTLYWNNHDMPRVVSNFGDPGLYRDNSAKMLATLMYLQKGIPIIYYGEEIGMKNLHVESMQEFRSPEAQEFYQKALRLGYDQAWALQNLQATSKDTSRGAMQWDNSPYAGFSKAQPWSGVNQDPAYTVEAQEKNPESVWHYYQKVLHLKQTELFTFGTYRMLDTGDEWYVYEREKDNKQALVICNVTNKPQSFDLPELEEGVYRRVVLENEGNQLEKGRVSLGPYGAVVFLIDHG